MKQGFGVFPDPNATCQISGIVINVFKKINLLVPIHVNGDQAYSFHNFLIVVFKNIHQPAKPDGIFIVLNFI